MKILIVGGSSVLAQALKKEIGTSMEVLMAGRSGQDVELDVCAENIEIPKGIQTVVHLSAQFGGKSLEDNIRTEEVNAIGALKVYNASIQAGVGHFIYLSSIYAKLDSSSPFFSTYSLSKRHAEELIRHAQKTHFLPVTILRPVQFYEDTGAGRKHQPFIYAIADKAEQNTEIVLQGNRDPHRNFIHVNDLATVIRKIIDYRLDGEFDCGSLENTSFRRICEAAIRAFHSKSEIRFDVSKPDVPDNVVELDHSIYQAINWYPAISIEEGMRRMADYRSTLQ